MLLSLKLSSLISLDNLFGKWKLIGNYSFTNSNILDIDLTNFITVGKPHLLSLTHNGYNNHNFLFFLSGHINSSYPVAQLIGYINGTFSISIKAIEKNIIRITIDQTRSYGCSISILTIG